jgi:prophage regulatory protein
MKLLRLPAAIDKRGVGRSSFYTEIKNGLMTEPVRNGPNTVTWPDDEIDAINRARIAGLDDEAIRRLVRRLHAARKSAVDVVTAEQDDASGR